MAGSKCDPRRRERGSHRHRSKIVYEYLSRPPQRQTLPRSRRQAALGYQALHPARRLLAGAAEKIHRLDRNAIRPTPWEPPNLKFPERHAPPQRVPERLSARRWEPQLRDCCVEPLREAHLRAVAHRGTRRKPLSDGNEPRIGCANWQTPFTDRRCTRPRIGHRRAVAGIGRRLGLAHRGAASTAAARSGRRRAARRWPRSPYIRRSDRRCRPSLFVNRMSTRASPELRQ